jgi:hypothetical protein
LNPAPSAVSANSLDPSIASKNLPGDVSTAQPSRPYDEKQLVQELATALDIKPQKGSSLEGLVANRLAERFGVKLQVQTTTTSGTGTGQGNVGQLRHNIASWFDNAMPNALSQTIPTPKLATVTPHAIDVLREQAMQIKSPKLRELALKKVQADEQSLAPDASRLVNEGAPPATPQPEPVQNAKALGQILDQVAKKLGAQGAGPNALADIAKSQNLPTGAPATPATQQTAGDAYQTFVKNLADPKTSASFAASQVPAFEAAGVLDKNAAGPKQANGTVYTDTQIASAYQAVLQQQVSQNQNESAALTALASTTAIPNAPTSEMQAYVSGVAQEFGVGLTPQQVTQIANTYGANAITAGQPSSVEDEIKNAVVALYDPTNPNNPAGVASTMFEDIKNSALQYQIPISDSQIGNMVKTDIQNATVESMYVAADAAMAAATKQFQQQAQGLYPALSSQIQSGQTVQNLVAPYFNVAEAVTGVPSSTMMADQQGGGLSKWSAFLQGGNNPAGATRTAPGTSATGSAAQAGPQMMTLDQWKTYLMQTPSYGFQNTQGAKDMAEQLTSAILNEFGKVSTTTSASPVNSLYQGASDLSANTAG